MNRKRKGDAWRSTPQVEHKIDSSLLIYEVVVYDSENINDSHHPRHSFYTTQELAKGQAAELNNDFLKKEREELIERKRNETFGTVRVLGLPRKNARVDAFEYSEYIEWPCFTPTEFLIRFRKKIIDRTSLAVMNGVHTTVLGVYEALTVNGNDSSLLEWIKNKKLYKKACVREYTLHTVVTPAKDWERSARTFRNKLH